jgi:hypothetical protein
VKIPSQVCRSALLAATFAVICAPLFRDHRESASAVAGGADPGTCEIKSGKAWGDHALHLGIASGYSNRRSMHRALRQLDFALGRYSLDRNNSLQAQAALLAELRELTKGQPPSEIARSLTPDELDTPFGREVLTAWLDCDPVAATGWIASNSGATDDQAWLVAQRIMTQPDLAECVQGQSEHSSWHQALLGYAAQQAIAQGPELAASLAAEMDPGPPQDAIRQQIAASWIVAEPDAAIGWIETLEPGPERDAAAMAAVAAIAPSEPQMGAALLNAIPAASGWTDAAAALSRNWAGRDPAAAAAWAEKLPPGDARKLALTSVFNDWRQAEPAAALTWYQALPEGPP